MRELYRDEPRKAALQWFAEARFGMFIHYGLYSLPGTEDFMAPERHFKTGDTLEKLLANLLLNTGPLPSGEIHPDDVRAFLETGKRIRKKLTRY